MRSNKKTFRIIVRKSKEGFRTDTVETANRLNMRKNINIRKPSISKKNNVIIFIREQMIMHTFETAKPERNTAVYQYEERKEE